MPETIVIADTSCLIALSRIDALSLLRQLYRRIIVTEDICTEFGEPLPAWVEVLPVADKKYQLLLENILDKGESSAITLAITLENVLLILDDLKGRREAKRLGLKITGTLGILFSAKQKGLIPALKPFIECLQAVDFRIAPSIISELLTLSGENGDGD
jgi:predicted nucleic acid-binding protein